MNKRIKVQCISTNSGFHTRLKRGKWYDAEICYKDKDTLLTDLYLIYQSQNDIYPELYDKKLFRTLSEKRDFKLNKLGV